MKQKKKLQEEKEVKSTKARWIEGWGKDIIDETIPAIQEEG